MKLLTSFGFVIVIFLNFSIPASTATSTEWTTPIFEIQPDNVFSKGEGSFYRKLLLDPSTKSIYVGAMNALYKLWMYNINDTSSAAFYSEILLPPTAEALEKCSYRSRNKEYQCQNHVTVLLKRPDGYLYVCSSNAYSPLVRKFDPLKFSSENSGMNGAAICPMDPDENSTAVWVDKGNPQDIPSVYYGTVTDFTQTNRIIYRPPLMDPKTGALAYSFMRTVHTDSKWLNEPNFVGSFENDAYVYFFFRETAVEFINCGKAVYSRVARICKNDVGGENVLKQNWATFTKVRLNCSIAGEFPFYFDEIQDVVKVEDAGGDIHFYATFTTNLVGFYGSAVCSYSLKSINELFERGLFKEQTSSSHAWLPVLSANVPDPRPGQCVEDTKKLSDTALHFIKSHPLIDGGVSAYGKKNSDQVGPLIYKKDVVFSKLVIDTLDINGKQLFVLFVATNDGKLYKILHWFESDGTSNSRLLSIYELPNRETVRALSLLYQQYVYIAQDNQVLQVEIGQCYRYRLCSTCVMDPYCTWNTVKQQCDRWQESYDQTTGWIRISAENPSNTVCIPQMKQLSKTAYLGDAVHLDCFSGGTSAAKSDQRHINWFKNNVKLNGVGQRYLLTIDGGLVLINITTADSGQYHCVDNLQTTAFYQLTVKNTNCQTPQNVNAYHSVYREWCREFQEYKKKIDQWQKRQEENSKCLKNGKFTKDNKLEDDKIYGKKKQRIAQQRR